MDEATEGPADRAADAWRAPVAAGGAAWLAAAICPVCDRPVDDRCGCSAPSCGCVSRCAGCDHRFRLRPEPALVEGSHYDAHYHDRRKTAGREGYGQKVHTFQLHFDVLRRVRPELAGLRLLDVGCATGDFLQMAGRRGVHGRGIELSPYAVARAQEHGLPVEQGTIDGVTDGPYDLLHASHVLEHVPDVAGFARAAAALVRPGGLALIEVPSEFDDALTTLRRWSGRDDGRRPASPHLHFFGASSLRRLFTDAGFAARRFLTYSHRRVASRHAPLLVRLRHVVLVNTLLRAADRLGRGRNLVMLFERAACYRCT